jgi:Holliday junction resolvase RusA-like endonuclease
MSVFPDTVVRFVIPGQPHGWQRTGQRIVKSKKTNKQFIVNYTTGETRADEWTLKRAATDALDGRAPLDGPVRLEITAYFGVPRSWSQKKQAEAMSWGMLPVTKPDFDNLSKIVDGIKGVVWRDDCQVAQFHFYKFYDERPRTVVQAALIDTSQIRKDRGLQLAVRARLAQSTQESSSPLIG